LTGYPSSVVGTNWIYTGLNNPYELRTMGYTPYTIANIDLSSSPALKTSFSGTVVIGDTTNPAIISGKSYNKLQITGGTLASYGGIIIDSTTGAISTTSSTVPGVYTIYLRNDGSYNVTTYILTVTSSGPVPCLTEDTLVLTPNGYIPVNKLTNGDKVRTSDKRDVVIQQIFQTIAVGNEKTYPCFIPKNSIGPNYPKEDLKISRDHLIQYKNMWIYPKRYFPLDKTQDIVKYFHIKLPNYMKDNLVINGGTVVESLCYHPSLPFKKKYMDEYKRRKSTWMDNVEIDEKLLTIKGNSKLKDKNKRDKILL
jgi:hypothetical protein